MYLLHWNPLDKSIGKPENYWIDRSQNEEVWPHTSISTIINWTHESVSEHNVDVEHWWLVQLMKDNGLRLEMLPRQDEGVVHTGGNSQSGDIPVFKTDESENVLYGRNFLKH